MNRTQGTTVFLLAIWTIGLILLAVAGVTGNAMRWYLALPFAVPLSIIVFLQLLIWLGRGIERITGRKL